MKILFLIDSLVSGGMERRFIELLKGLKSYPEYEFRVVAFSENIHYREIYDLGIPIKIIRRVPKRNPLVFYRLYKYCKSFSPNLIHSWGTMSAILAIPSSLLLNIKLINGNIVNAPNNMKFYNKDLIRAKITYPFSAVIVGNSLAGLRAYKVPTTKGICIYNGIDNNRILNLKSKIEVKNRFNITTDKIIGMVGSFSARKDYKTYLKAALLIINQRKDVTFISVGDGPNLRECKEMIPSEFSRYFIFTGIQSDVESLVNMCDIGVLATNAYVHGEGISNSILEYMILEKPVVATSGGGTNEVIEHNKNGILVSPDSSEKMARSLLYLLNNPEIGKKMGHEGKKLIKTQFSLPQMTKSYCKLYKAHIKE